MLQKLIFSNAKVSLEQIISDAKFVSPKISFAYAYFASLICFSDAK